MTEPPAESAPVREEVIDLLTTFDSFASKTAGQLIHGDGRTFSDREKHLFGTATAAEKRAAEDRHCYRIQHLDELEADRARLYEIAWAAPHEIGERFMDALDENHLGPNDGPQVGDLPANEFTRQMERHLAVLVRVFRACVLPDLGGPVRTEAEEILARFKPITDPHLGNED